jgi:para-aminobenzoate synthetase component 1
MPSRWVEPFAAALALRDEPGLVLLESLPGFGRLGRRSFLAARPAEVATGGLNALDGLGASPGRWAGWLSYDLGREVESMPSLARDDLGLPPLALGRFESWIEFDHDRRQVAVLGGGPARHLERALAQAATAGAPKLGSHRPVAAWESSLPRPRYEDAVRRAIDYIRAGDVFQVNLSQRLEAGWEGDPFALHARLRRASPAPFAALVRLGGADIVSASPELFLRRRGSLLETRPIKGTRPRGRTSAADLSLARELEASTKDRAENVMIVDLARNDLGRVARYGTVRVTGLFELESHPGVHHLVSAVEAELRDGVGPRQIVRATFPPGSVTGAPKVRALEIIEEIEPCRRGPYCGAIGWFGPGDDLELSVAIRTFTAARGRLALHVGGAVVADSDPTAEWQESMDKAAKLLEAAGGAVRLERREWPGAGGRRPEAAILTSDL